MDEELYGRLTAGSPTPAMVIVGLEFEMTNGKPTWPSERFIIVPVEA